MTSTSSVSSTTATSAPDEALFLSHIEALKPIPVVFHDAYQAPPHLLPSRTAVLHLDILPPPEKKVPTSAANLAEVLNVTFKSLKPAYSVTLPIQPADSIQHLKSLLTTSASPLAGTTVRLLLKGKALADTKLVKDYEIKDGSVITVMMSTPAAASTTNKSSADTPTADTASAAAAAAAAAPSNTSSATPSYSMDLSAADRDPVPAAASPSLGASTPGTGHKRRVSDIPAVTLSPAGTPAATTPLLQPVSLTADPLTHIPLTPSSPSSKSTSIAIDLASIPLPLSTSSQHSDDPYHQTLASPQFWKDLKGFLDGRFGKEKGGRAGDEQVAFEEFLRSVKGSLSPNEIARIRDEVGITGMAGN